MRAQREAAWGAVRLQWGRALDGAEIFVPVYLVAVEKVASMGPRLGWRGNFDPGQFDVLVVDASMGPRLGWRGNAVGKPRRDRGLPSFNGAAPWMARKLGEVIADAPMVRPLQWGRALDGAEMVAFATWSSITAYEAVFERLLAAATFVWREPCPFAP